ncbi:hypothetical protein [Paenibacillus sp. SI8]|uniref:hypothetical protein n=1 Tax=unclassified Paenibacillus TaxID=185978 RepID=UPI0034658D5D
MSVQLFLAISIISIFHMFSLFLIINKLNKYKKVRNGLDLGVQFPEVNFEDIKRNSYEFNNSVFDSFRVFVFLDSGCNECTKVLNAFKVINLDLVKDIMIILTYTEDNISLSTHPLKDRMIFIQLNVIQNEFKLNSFPFYLRVNNSGLVIDKGYIASDSVMESINR